MEEENETSAVEDLMREHGILNRILLIYEEFIRRIKHKINFNLLIVYYTALIIRKFIEDYHEKTEEQYVFKVLEKSNKYNEITKELYKQHQLGRKLTDLIMKYSKQTTNNSKLMLCLKLFVKMYRYHESVEDVIIFPAFKSLLTKKQYNEYGELFEHEEDQILGRNGFKKCLDTIIQIEKILEIHDLSKITKYIEEKLIT